MAVLCNHCAAEVILMPPESLLDKRKAKTRRASAPERAARPGYLLHPGVFLIK